MNKKGFTLVELLATIVILGILMMVAVPNIMGVLNNNKNSTYVEDAKKFVTLAEYAVRSNKVEKPKNGECIVFDLFYLDNSEFESPPNGGKYEKNASYVVVKKDVTGAFNYYVKLVETYGKSKDHRGVSLVESSELYTAEKATLIANLTVDNLLSSLDANGNISKDIFDKGGIISCPDSVKAYTLDQKTLEGTDEG